MPSEYQKYDMRLFYWAAALTNAGRYYLYKREKEREDVSFHKTNNEYVYLKIIMNAYFSYPANPELEYLPRPLSAWR